MKSLLCIAALALPLLSACGEKEEQPYFQVLGQAKIEKKAEIFVSTMHISEHAKDKIKSLEASSKKLSEIRSSLGSLERIKYLKIRTETANTETVRPIGCRLGRVYGNDKYPDNCDPIDHISRVSATIEAGPAEMAGTVLSLLTELGAEQVTVERFDVRDRTAAEMEARKYALRDATETAEALARQSSVKLGAPLEVRYGQPGNEARIFEKLGEDSPDRIPPSGSPAIRRMTTTFKMELPPDVVTFEARVAVKFALEKAETDK